MNHSMIRTVLSNYSMNSHTCEVLPLRHAVGGRSAEVFGTEHWKINLPGASYCLRRWPKITEKHPGAVNSAMNRLEYIQAVLWYAVYEGFHLVPLPCETFDRKGYVFHGNSFWELLPWLKGTQDDCDSDDFAEHVDITVCTTSAARVVSAMMTLAQFHEITSTFPLPNEPKGTSAIVQKLLDRWRKWGAGDIAVLMNHIRSRQCKSDDPWELELIRESFILLDHFLSFGVQGITMLSRATHLSVPIQPTIGNANRRHLLFDRDCVCGMLDFKELGVDSVAWDVASLLGSMAGNDPKLWQYGLKAYHSIRPLGTEELYLVSTLDLVQMILTGLNLLEFYFFKRQSFLSLEQLRVLVSEVRWLTGRLDDYRFEKMNFAA